MSQDSPPRRPARSSRGPLWWIPLGGLGGFVLGVLAGSMGLQEAAGPRLPVVSEAGTLRPAVAPGEDAASERASVSPTPKGDQEIEDLRGQLGSAEGERDRCQAENRRLRESLVQKEQRLEALTHAIGALRAAGERSHEPEVTVTHTRDRTIDARLHQLNEALAAAGIEQWKVLEVGAWSPGRLDRVLLASLDGRGLPGAVESWDHALLEQHDGSARLVFERPVDAPPAEGSDPARRELRLVGPEPALWDELGLPLPQGSGELAAARAELERALADTAYRVLALQGVRDGEWLGLELSEQDPEGRELRRLRAPQARLEPGGTILLLLGGDAHEAGVTRPFYKGKLRISLPDPRPSGEADPPSGSR